MKEPSPTDSRETRAIGSRSELIKESTGQLDNEAGGYTTDGFRKSYMLRKHHQFFKGTNIITTDSLQYSDPIQVAPHSDFILYVNAVQQNTPADLRMQVQCSPDGHQWYDLQDGVFGGWTIGSAASPLKECYAGTILGKFMRIMLYSNIIQGGALWNVNVEAEFLQP